MTQRVPRSLLALLCVGVLSVAAVLPAGAQEDTGQEEATAPSGVSGFESIDGTRLRPAALSYDATMEMGGKQMDLSSTLTITATSAGGADSAGRDDTWTLVNKIDMPRGTSTDSLIMDRSSLLPVSRHRRGGARMDITYSGRPAYGGHSASGKMKVSGEMKTGGQTKPISKELEGPVLAAGVHDVIALAGMPIGPGFHATLRIFSPQDQSTKQAEFEVVGTETAQTPAGLFETYEVDLNVGDGYVTGTVHLRKEPPHYYVKWKTKVSSDRGTRTVTQTLSSMEIQAPPSAQ